MQVKKMTNKYQNRFYKQYDMTLCKAKVITMVKNKKKWGF